MKDIKKLENPPPPEPGSIRRCAVEASVGIKTPNGMSLLRCTRPDGHPEPKLHRFAIVDGKNEMHWYEFEL